MEEALSRTMAQRGSGLSAPPRRPLRVAVLAAPGRPGRARPALAAPGRPGGTRPSWQRPGVPPAPRLPSPPRYPVQGSLSRRFLAVWPNRSALVQPLRSHSFPIHPTSPSASVAGHASEPMVVPLYSFFPVQSSVHWFARELRGQRMVPTGTGRRLRPSPGVRDRPHHPGGRAADPSGGRCSGTMPAATISRRPLIMRVVRPAARGALAPPTRRT
jgi:hypothetical protein